MRFDKLDLNLLVALDALISERSVTAASKRLCLSQPAVTAALNRLRDYFGDDLLVLEGRQMRLTYKAEQLAAPVNQTLELIRREITQPGDFDPLTSTRKFVIISSDYVQTVLLGEALAQAASLAPLVRFEIIRPSTDAVERFERSEADLIISVKPLCPPQHPAIPIFNDEHVLVSWRDSDFDEVISTERFLASGHVVATFGLDRSPALSEISLEHFRETRRIELLVPSFSALAQSVVGTQRIATMHRKLAEHFLPFYPIRIHESPVPIAPIEQILVWHRLRSRDSGMKWLRGLILNQSTGKFGPPINSADEIAPEFRLDG
jgi:LysR family nod box-dependent transcriptional activator